jgi:hypothetical protein
MSSRSGGETIEKPPLMRAATRAIGLRAAKGDVKAYAAVSAKLAAAENRRRVQQEELLRAVTEYRHRATQELTRRKRNGESGPEIIPHPDDIDIDPRTGAVIFNGPLTPDQKMAQDLVVSAWPAMGRELRNSPLFRAKDPRSLRGYAKFRRYFGTVVRLVEKRASKTNSWDLATLEERMDHLRRRHWAKICAKYDFPPEFVQSECYFKIDFLRLAQDRADRGGKPGVSNHSSRGVPKSAVKRSGLSRAEEGAGVGRDSEGLRTVGL